MESLLEVRDLSVRYRSKKEQDVLALDAASLRIAPGEILGVLGESGSGKSTLAASVLSLFPPTAVVEAGAVFFQGRNLFELDSLSLARVRGKSISLIFQEPAVALHPTMRVGSQIDEILRAHTKSKASDRGRTVRELLAMVFPSDAERVYASYPHQLSGGQRQRVVTTQAIACGPSLLIADEPTASLDPVTQRGILHLFKRLQRELQLAILFITHSPDLLAGFADRILVMYAGRIVETGDAEDVLSSPKHPYTKALLQCRPKLEESSESTVGGRLPVILGNPPDLSRRISGCAFEPRCLDKVDVCRERRPMFTKAGETQEVTCFRLGDSFKVL